MSLTEAGVVSGHGNAPSEPGRVPSPDWYVRCEAEMCGERCFFPSLDSRAWHIHGEQHETLTFGWGHDKVEKAKEARRVY